MAETSKVKTVMVNAGGGISYPENFISANNIAQTTLIDGANSTFQSAVTETFERLGTIYVPTIKTYGIYNWDSESSIPMISFNSADITINDGYPFCVDNIYGRRSYLMNNSGGYYEITFDTDGIDIGHSNKLEYGKLLNVSTSGIKCLLTNDSTNSQFSVLTKYPTNSEVPYTQTDINTDKVNITSKSEFNIIGGAGQIHSGENNVEISSEVGLSLRNNSGSISIGSDSIYADGVVIRNENNYISVGINVDDKIVLNADNGDMLLNSNSNIRISSQSGITIDSDAGSGIIGLNGTVKINGTLLEDMIGTGGSFQYITEPVSPSGVLEIGKMSVGQIDIAGGMYVNIESQNIIKLSTPNDNYDNYIKLDQNTLDITLSSVHSNISVGSGKVVIAGDDEIILNSCDGRINCDSPISAPVYIAPVYNEAEDGFYTKTEKTVELRVVERDGAYTIVID